MIGDLPSPRPSPASGRGRIRPRAICALAAGAFCVFAAPAGAADPAASDWFVTDQGRVRLVAAPSTEPASVPLGLEFRLAPGWKVYWRSPGDAGLPPSIDWSGSTNLKSAEIAWPAPRRFSAYGLETIGYEEAVVLPIRAQLAEAGAPLGLKAALDYLTCKEICIPYSAELRLDLPGGGVEGGGYGDLIAAFARQVPHGGSESGLRVTAARLALGSTPALTLSLAAERPLGEPDAFIEGPAGIGFAAPRRELDGTRGRLILPLSGNPAALHGLAGRSLRVTIVDGERAVETAIVPSPGPPPRDPARLPAMLGIALLGGFILNFMPCVLPVLSIKLLSVAAHAGRQRRAVRAAFLATAGGILASFLVLAAAMAGLKAAGLAVGWGVQFQQPVFLTAMMALLALFACNLAGLFEIPLPGWLADLAAGGAARAEPGLAGDFAAGAVATLLATPCSAPYLGTAVGFALTGETSEIVAVFAALGIGLALPYLLVAAFPAVAALVPRPGRWMLVLRRILAVLLAGTALWLLAVLAAQTAPATALAVALALAAAGAAALLVRSAALRRGGIAAALLAAAALPAALPVAQPPAQKADLWRGFDSAAIARLVGEGKIVFVDVTADWCINCKVNERLVLDSAEVQSRLSRPEVVAMRADWTRPDAAIGEFLRGFGRYGIPFYAVFGPGSPDGQPLPEILTTGEVMDALRKAAPSTAADPRNGDDFRQASQ